MSADVHPRERFLTVYGRMPVLEALRDDRVSVEKVLIAHSARGENLTAIQATAAKRGVRVEKVTPQKVKTLAGNGRHDQGVVADVLATRMRSLEAFRGEVTPRTLALVLDGITNPSNLGMILRTATAAGFDAIVVPAQGTAAIGPLAIKASAGIAFTAPIVRCRSIAVAMDTLRELDFEVIGLAGEAKKSLYEYSCAGPSAFVLGNETNGISPVTRAAITGQLHIPMVAGVESLNVASAAAVLCFELARQRARGYRG